MTLRVEEASPGKSLRSLFDTFPGRFGGHFFPLRRRYFNAPPAAGTTVVRLFDEILEPYGATPLAYRDRDVGAVSVFVNGDGIVILKTERWAPAGA